MTARVGSAKEGQRPLRDDEGGQILVLVLAMVIVLGILVGALAGLAAPSFTHSTVVRNLNDTVTAADSGVEFGVAYLKLHLGQCPAGGNISIPPTIEASFNNRIVVVSCQPTTIAPPPPPGISYVALTSMARVGASGSSTIQSRAILEVNDFTGAPTVQSWRTCHNGEC